MIKQKKLKSCVRRAVVEVKYLTHRFLEACVTMGLMVKQGLKYIVEHVAGQGG